MNNRDRAILWGRRAAVLTASAAILVIGIATVQVAADWRRASAPLDTAPVGMSTIGADLTTETDRAAVLAGQIDQVAAQITDLKWAVSAANGSIVDDQDQAADLQARLDKSTARLTTLQRQLKAAQARLTQLNRAAARQAELNRQAGVRSAGSAASTSSRGGDDDHGEEDDD